MADVEALCKRVIVIHHGKLLFDGPLSGLVQQFSSYKTIRIDLPQASLDLSAYGEVLSQGDGQAVLRIPKAQASQVTARLLAEQNVVDLTVEDTPVDDVIDMVFSQAAPVEGAG
jgi:ABC-2 type transport system ATP-binding protein